MGGAGEQRRRGRGRRGADRWRRGRRCWWSCWRVVLGRPARAAAPRGTVVRRAVGHRATCPAGTLDAAAARTALDRLPVAAKGGLAGYERGCGGGAGCVFGPAWADVDHNGCDQRNDVLHRDLTAVQVRPARTSASCRRQLADPYTGTTVTFAKAQADRVQIDHVVPLAAAWTQGAARGRRAAGGVRQRPGQPDRDDAGPTSRRATTPPTSGCRRTPAFGCAYARVVVT